MKSALVSTVVSVGLLFLISTVYAPWSTLGTGYAITSNVHGIDTPPFTTVVVTAGTLDSNVEQVTFRWHEPPDGNGPVAREVAVPVFTNTSKYTFKNGTQVLIRYAIDSYSPDVVGDWGVQAFFQDSVGTDKAGLNDVIKIRATSFNVVPEVPFGTIVILLSMFGALSVFALKKRRITTSHIQA